MTIVLPKEHGAWAMLVVPFVVGVVTNGPTWLHLPLFIGGFFFYLSSYPLLMIIRNSNKTNIFGKWLAIYAITGAVFLLIPLYFHWELLALGLLLIPLSVLNLYFTKAKREREFVNNLSAIASLALGAVASMYVSVGAWTWEAFWAWIYCVLFFAGSVFFVKSKIREKSNRSFLYCSWFYHCLLVFIPMINAQWLLSLAFVPSLYRSLAFCKREMTPLQIGKVEILNSIFFTIGIISYLRL
ncbi:YwiC-like family protein [Desulfotomaculum defluvii]